MPAVTKTASLWGMIGHPVRVEVHIGQGLPNWHLVGLGDKTIHESVNRIKSALINAGYQYPRKDITVNLAPAGKPKEGSHFDLPVAIALLAASGIVQSDVLDQVGLLGELSLGGKLMSVNGALPLVKTMAEDGLKTVILPKGNAEEAALLKGLMPELTIFPADSLVQVVDHLQGERCLVAQKESRLLPAQKSQGDYGDVTGQEAAKRAMLICAAGGHGLLMEGSPGCGKTMLAKRLPSILPTLQEEEKLETTMIHSVAGLLTEEMPYVSESPFVAIHQGITRAGLLGGGSKPKPGAFSLAHRGVLFMDEFLQYDKKLIDAMRVPLEEGKVTIARAGGTAVFPAEVIFVAAANPCPCGWYGDAEKKCTCTEGQLQRFRSKMSGPVTDRIDMHIEMKRVDTPEIRKEKHSESASMRKIVEAARTRQQSRYAEESFSRNAQITVDRLDAYCPMEKEAEDLLRNAFSNLGLTMRTYHRIRRVARTIADIEGSETILQKHVAEALQYRMKDNR